MKGEEHDIPVKDFYTNEFLMAVVLENDFSAHFSLSHRMQWYKSTSLVVRQHAQVFTFKQRHAILISINIETTERSKLRWLMSVWKPSKR
ncbi:hypothetical protein QFZ78_004188 [Paenibacillus sp. V4I5]|nr:hypothetical protein [Paenibacillus sp. V4I5]